MIRISTEANFISVRAEPGDLAPKHENQLAFWGFVQRDGPSGFTCPADKGKVVTRKLVAFLTKAGLGFELADDLTQLLSAQDAVAERLTDATLKGRRFKDAEHLDSELGEFLAFVKRQIPRRLKDHQLKAAMHFLAVENGANFSVPGSGKTTVVLAIFEWLRSRGIVDSLFVVGPPSCFGPWRHEYSAVIGRAPKCEIMAGGDIDIRRGKYCVDAHSTPDMYLTSFQTLQRDSDQVRVLFEQQSARYFLVVDEAHYIKQVNGAWANAVLNIANYATRRCVLTGTPFPRTYEDGFNLFDVLWPESPPLSTENKHRIAVYSQRKDWERAAEILQCTVGPLFYRVRKADLGLAPQVLHPPILVKMNEHERLVYDSILDRIQDLSQTDYFRNLDLLLRLRRGRMTRLRQCLSYTPLLKTAVIEYSEDLLTDDRSLSDVISHYDQLEVPGKIQRLMQLVADLMKKGEKVVVWSNFVKTLEHIRDTLNAAGIGVRLIYGATPIEDRSEEDELTREKIIDQFVDPASDVRVLVANPAACAESISLHKSCSHAIYYDLSYNCAQYIQSLDRIHRVGGSEKRPSHYYFLQYENTIDRNILSNVRRKSENMSRVVDQEYPVYGLDMFGEDDELEAYDQLFGGDRKGV